MTKITHLKVSNSVSFSTFINLYNHHFFRVLKHFHHHQRSPHTHKAGLSPLPLSQSLATYLWICLFWIFHVNGITYSVTFQFSSVAQSGPTLCNPTGCSTPGFPVHHQLPDLTQTHVHWAGGAILPSHPLSSPSPPAFNLSQYIIFKSHRCCSVDEYFIPFYSWIQCPLSAYTSLFIRPSISGQLWCFRLLAVVNRAAMNMCIHVFEPFLVVLGYT